MERTTFNVVDVHPRLGKSSEACSHSARRTFSVLFFIRRTRLNKHGEASVEMRLTINGVRIDTALKRSVPPDLWNPEKGRALPRTHEYRELNAYLDTAKLRLLQLQREMEIDGIPVTAKGLLDKYLGIDDAPRRILLEVFREHNDRCAKLSGIDMSPTTVERYETSYKHTAAFIQHAYGKKDVYLDDVNHKFIVDYEFYLKTERHCAHNTATKYLKNFKKIIRIALANEWIAKDPFVNIKFRLDEVDRDFLEEHELKQVMENSLPIERLAQVRDAFVFACFTWLAFSDLQGLRDEHIVTDNNGAKWICKKRQKTKNMCNIPLLKVPLEIIEKYRGHPECVKKGVLLSVMSNQKMNAYLRELRTCAELQSKSRHTGRHTFANSVALANGVSMESVAKMLGHSNTNMTRHYARVLDLTIYERDGQGRCKICKLLGYGAWNDFYKWRVCRMSSVGLRAMSL